MIRIAIHGAPRSGTTWLANIFNSHEGVSYRQQPLFSYAFKGYLNEASSPEKIQDFFEQLYLSQDDYLHQIKEIDQGKVPRFNKDITTHLVYKEVRYHYILDNLLQHSDVKLIALIRNPFAVLNSFFHAPSEFKPGWSVEEEWKEAPKKNLNLKENYFGYQKWKESAMIFHELLAKYGEERVYIVTYKDLLANVNHQTEILFEWAGLVVTNQTREFIMKSTHQNNSNAYSVFKTKTKDIAWKETIPQKIVDYINNDLKHTPLEKYLTL